MNERWPLPDGWLWIEASQLGQIVGGGTPPAADPSNFEQGEAGIPWITPADLTGYEGVYISRGRRNLSQKGLTSCGARVMPAGTVLFSSRAPIGYCAIASNPISTNQGFKSILLNKDLVPEFARYYLLASKEFAETLASGTTFKELSGARMATMPVPVAPEPDQRRIVAKLDSLFARSKSAREELSRIPNLVERYKQAVLAAAFRGMLTAEWRAQHDQHPGSTLRNELLGQKAAAMNTRGVRSKPTTGDILVSDDLPHLPQSWTWMSIDELATKVVDGVHKKPNYIDAGIPFLTVRNLTAGPSIVFDGCRFISDEDHREFIKRTHPEFGDLLITKDGTLGVVRAIRTTDMFSIFVSLALVKPVDRQMTDYLEHALTSSILQKQMVGVGSGLQHIHLNDLRRDMVPVAPAEEQQEIVNAIRRAFAAIDEAAAEQTKAASLLDRLEQSVLAKAFRGELVGNYVTDTPNAN